MDKEEFFKNLRKSVAVNELLKKKYSADDIAYILEMPKKEVIEIINDINKRDEIMRILDKMCEISQKEKVNEIQQDNKKEEIIIIEYDYQIFQNTLFDYLCDNNIVYLFEESLNAIMNYAKDNYNVITYEEIMKSIDVLEKYLTIEKINEIKNSYYDNYQKNIKRLIK